VSSVPAAAAAAAAAGAEHILCHITMWEFHFVCTGHQWCMALAPACWVHMTAACQVPCTADVQVGDAQVMYLRYVDVGTAAASMVHGVDMTMRFADSTSCT
jgi:hypothetical protein